MVVKERLILLFEANFLDISEKDFMVESDDESASLTTYRAALEPFQKWHASSYSVLHYLQLIKEAYTRSKPGFCGRIRRTLLLVFVSVSASGRVTTTVGHFCKLELILVNQ